MAVVVVIGDFFFASKTDLNEFREFFDSLGLSAYLVFDQFDCDADCVHPYSVTIEPHSTFLADDFNGDFAELINEDEAAALELFYDALAKQLPRLRYC